MATPSTMWHCEYIEQVPFGRGSFWSKETFLFNMDEVSHPDWKFHTDADFQEKFFKYLHGWSTLFTDAVEKGNSQQAIEIALQARVKYISQPGDTNWIPVIDKDLLNVVVASCIKNREEHIAACVEKINKSWIDAQSKETYWKEKIIQLENKTNIDWKTWKDFEGALESYVRADVANTSLWTEAHEAISKMDDKRAIDNIIKTGIDEDAANLIVAVKMLVRVSRLIDNFRESFTYKADFHLKLIKDARNFIGKDFYENCKDLTIENVYEYNKILAKELASCNISLQKFEEVYSMFYICHKDDSSFSYKKPALPPPPPPPPRLPIRDRCKDENLDAIEDISGPFKNSFVLTDSEKSQVVLMDPDMRSKIREATEARLKQAQQRGLKNKSR